jgi:hypothetical protein
VVSLSFPLRLQRFNRVGLCDPLGESQPSLSRRFELFAMSPGILRSAIFRHSADVNTFSRSRIKELFAGAPFPHRSPRRESSGGHDRLEERVREKEPVDFPAIHSRKSGLGLRLQPQPPAGFFVSLDQPHHPAPLCPIKCMYDVTPIEHG